MVGSGSIEHMFVSAVGQVEQAAPAGEMPLERLEAELLVMASRSNAAMAAWLVAVEEFDRREGYVSWEVPSTARWLAWKCGMDRRTARDYVRVARALPGLPATRAAFASGELPYCKVRALTRIATARCEDRLLDLARTATTAQLERIVRVSRRGLDEEEALDRAEAEAAEGAG